MPSQGTSGAFSLHPFICNCNVVCSVLKFIDSKFMSQRLVIMPLWGSFLELFLQVPSCPRLKQHLKLDTVAYTCRPGYSEDQSRRITSLSPVLAPQQDPGSKSKKSLSIQLSGRAPLGLILTIIKQTIPSPQLQNYLGWRVQLSGKLLAQCIQKSRVKPQQ